MPPSIALSIRIGRGVEPKGRSIRAGAKFAVTRVMAIVHSTMFDAVQPIFGPEFLSSGEATLRLMGMNGIVS